MTRAPFARLPLIIGLGLCSILPHAHANPEHDDDSTMPTPITSDPIIFYVVDPDGIRLPGVWVQGITGECERINLGKTKNTGINIPMATLRELEIGTILFIRPGFQTAAVFTETPGDFSRQRCRSVIMAPEPF